MGIKLVGSPDQDSCGNCRYYGDVKNDQGECRRFPPQVIVLPVRTFEGQVLTPAACYPVVEVNKFGCGEHAPLNENRLNA